MAEYEDVAARFARDIEHHEMAVLHDDGLYRHLKFAKPGTGLYSFGIFSWPGGLAICGDMDDFAFLHPGDLFPLFRGEGINPSYWSTKVFGGTTATAYSEAMFRQVVAEHVADDRVLSALVKVEIFDNPDIADEESARSLLDAFEYDGFRFADTWEWGFQDFTSRFLWCCYAIVWGIQQYDAHKAALVGGAGRG